MSFQNRGLVNTLCGLNKNWRIEDYFNARKERNWEQFDRLSDDEKLLYRIREAREYTDGYYTDEAEEPIY